MSLIIQLPVRSDQTAYNLKRWEEVLVDPHFAKLDGTFETDRYGQVIVMPPPSFRHGRLQRRISTLLAQLMENGETVTECPVSTPDGVKGVDVIWMTDEQLNDAGETSCLPFAPEICIEIKSPTNSMAALDEKKSLYFAAGAKEVWICNEEGEISFFIAEEEISTSNLCSDFPTHILLDE